MSGDLSAFEAFATHPSLGDDPASGCIAFDAWRLRFQSETFTLEFPLARTQVTRETEDDDRIDFQDPQQPDWLIYCFQPEILKNSSLLKNPFTRRQLKAIESQGELKRRLKLTLWVLAGFAFAAVIISGLLGFMVSSLVASIPPEWERELGTNLLQEVRHHVVFADDPRFKVKLDQAVNPLMAVIPTNSGGFSFYIVQSPTPNAFAIPGGLVFVNTGLLEMADRPEEIAGVVAHEIAHVTQKHGFRKVISTAGPYLVFKMFLKEAGGVMDLLGSSSQLLVSRKFSQEYELEADDVGWAYLVKAHIDPHGMIEVLQKFKLMQDNMQSGELRIEALDDHPATDKRIRRLVG
jgi:Zn-dependent protease with chaperone function